MKMLNNVFQAYIGSFRTIEIFLIPQTSFVNPIISPFTGMTFKEGKPQILKKLDQLV